MADGKKRELLPDVLRGFAICLVVLGHCIQEGSGEVYKLQEAYFDDRLYQLIYSFHMPLFMLVSGWLGWYSMRTTDDRREQLRILGRRAASLLIPIFGWTALDSARHFLMNAYYGYPHAGLGQGLLQYIVNSLENLWFLWAVFWCFLIVWCMHYWFHDALWLYIVGFLMMFFIPDGLGLGAYKYMLPFYIIAFYFHEGMAERHNKENAISRLYEIICNVYEQAPIVLTLAAGLVWILLFAAFFNQDAFIYLTGYKLLGKDITRQLAIDGYRFIIGLSGSCFVILLWKDILQQRKGYGFPVFSCLGRNSMGIYIVSGYVIILGIAEFTQGIEPSYAVNLAEMLIVLLISTGFTEIIGQIPAIGRLVGKMDKYGTDKESCTT